MVSRVAPVTAPLPPSAVTGHGVVQKPIGLRNIGNTCYANAALQCLLSTALSHALLDPKTVVIFRRYSSNPNLLALGSRDDHDEDAAVTAAAQKCPQQREKHERQRHEREREKLAMEQTCQWLTQELTRITRAYAHGSQRALQQQQLAEQQQQKSFSFWNSPSSNEEKQEVVDPGNITMFPNKLSKCLRPYQQEDAHEFLRALLSTLVMNGRNKQLSSLFDGLLESAVTCSTCGCSSLTRDRYMDLSLDISHNHVLSLENALQEFTQTELLDGDNQVYCEKCECKQVVTKGLRLATAPSIMVCHLKRFACDKYGRLVRLAKHISFPLKLEIDNYMSLANRSTPQAYELVGVLVHQGGHSCDSGHYLAYVKAGSDQWYKANDSVVTRVDVETVLAQKAYILVYEVAGMRRKCHVSKTTASANTAAPSSSRKTKSKSVGVEPPSPSQSQASSSKTEKDSEEKEECKETLSVGSSNSGNSISSGDVSVSGTISALMGLLTVCAPESSATLAIQESLLSCCGGPTIDTKNGAGQEEKEQEGDEALIDKKESTTSSKRSGRTLTRESHQRMSLSPTRNPETNNQKGTTPQRRAHSVSTPGSGRFRRHSSVCRAEMNLPTPERRKTSSSGSNNKGTAERRASSFCRGELDSTKAAAAKVAGELDTEANHRRDTSPLAGQLPPLHRRPPKSPESSRQRIAKSGNTSTTKQTTTT